MTGYAYDFEVDGIYYNLDSNGDAVVTYGDVKYSGDVSIPFKVHWKGKDRKVVGIGDNAFQNCEDLTAVDGGYYVTFIGHFAFDECHNLKSIHIPYQVNFIGRFAFFACRSLKAIDIPGAVEIIGDFAFSSCSSLQKIDIHTAVTEISEGVFADCEALQQVKLYGQVESIGDIAFRNCYALVHFYCYALNVPKMGKDVFLGSDVQRAYLHMQEGRMGAYMDDDTWGEFGIYRSVYEVKRDGFWYRLKYDTSEAAIINNPDEYGYTVEYDGDIVIPSQITVSNNNKYTVAAIGDNAFKYSKLNSISIPETVTKIGDRAFKESGLKSIVIPNSVTDMHSWVFDGNSELKSIVLPNSLDIIRYGMARDCKKLQRINIPNTVTEIMQQAFESCESLESIIIPSSVTDIGPFAFERCLSMTDVYCQAYDVPQADIDAFYKSPIENMTLYVPSESINEYKTTAPWSGFGKIKALTTGIEKTETAAKPMITTADGQISVSGLSGNATIQVLSLDGKLLDSSTALNGTATLNALPGEVVIVKVGTESYKVVVK